jgi:hypothetical protein
MKLALSFLLTFSAATAVAETPEEKGLRLTQEADRKNEGYVSERAAMTMDLVNAHGDSTTRKLAIETLEGKADGDKSLASFEWPADVKGAKMLTWTHKQGDDDQWLYLPAVKRVKRISSSNKSGSFMGSEFAYEDLGSSEVEKFTYRFLGDVKEVGRDCYQIERTALDKNSGYKRQVVWMDVAYAQPLRIDYYDRKNELLKTATFSGYQQHGKFWRVGKIEVQNVQTKKRSILTWTSRKLGQAIDAAAFDSAALEE